MPKRINIVSLKLVRERSVPYPTAVTGPESVAKLRRLCRDLGLMTPVAKAVWRTCGLYEEDARTVDPAAEQAAAA